MTLNDTWFTGEVVVEGKTAIIRGRSHLGNLMNSNFFPSLVQITWRFETPTENGIPTPEENLFMTEIEDALVAILEKDLQSVLAFTQIFDNNKIWFFYSRSTDEFGIRLNEALSVFRRVPIEIENHSDPDWETYKTLLADFDLEVN